MKDNCKILSVSLLFKLLTQCKLDILKLKVKWICFYLNVKNVKNSNSPFPSQEESAWGNGTRCPRP